MNTLETTPHATTSDIQEYSVQTSHEQLSPDIILEMAGKIAQIEQQFGGTFESLVQKLSENDPETGEQAQSLQEKHNLNFDPEKTIRGAGSFALVMVMEGPEAIQREIKEEVVKTMAGEEQEDVDQPDEEEQAPDDLEKYMAQAKDIVDKLFWGDSSGLSHLPTHPENFQDALRVRMKFRINQFNDGEFTTAEMKEDMEKMYSVAAIGLRIANSTDKNS